MTVLDLINLFHFFENLLRDFRFFRQPSQKEKVLKLVERQQIIEGYIEILFFIDRRKMVLNEEGKLEGLPMNPEATRIVHENHLIWENDCIVGTVLLAAPGEID